MQNNILIAAILLMFCMVFTGCNKSATCILWQTGGYERSSFESVKSKSKLKDCKHVVGVVLDKEEGKLYTKQMVRRVVDTLLLYTADIEEIEIYPIEQGYNTRKRGAAYFLSIKYAPQKRVIACVFSDGIQFVLPPYPEQLIEVKNNIEVSDSVQKIREDRRATIVRDFYKEEGCDILTESFIRGYWKYQLFAPSFTPR